MTEMKLTAEQEEFLKTCEEEFQSKYTDSDEAFTKIKKNKSNCPPIADPWYSKSRKPYYAQRQNQGHSNYERNYNRSYDNRPYDKSYSRNRDRPYDKNYRQDKYYHRRS